MQLASRWKQNLIAALVSVAVNYLSSITGLLGQEQKHNAIKQSKSLNPHADHTRATVLQDRLLTAATTPSLPITSPIVTTKLQTARYVTSI